jgi:site-specific DNA recombinase
VQRWNLPDGWVISTPPAHPALVTEADFIAVQEISTPRGPVGTATRRYLLAGLIRCGTCGRRLESSWSNGHPAYRCRHGYTSATRPDSTRARTSYIREDQILPHLAALAILLASHEPVPGRPGQAGQIASPAQAAELIDHLRSSGRQGEARVTLQPACKRPLMGNNVSEGGLEPFAYLLQSPDDAWLDVRGSA